MFVQARLDVVKRQDILSSAQTFLDSMEGITGLQYLEETRKISKKIIKEFQLGYIPSFESNQFAGRIIFPILDCSNNLIAITTRNVDGPEKLPKYWHEAYEKSYYLYGINIAKVWMRKWKFCILTEGQFDVLQMHNYGIRNTVGLSGSSFSTVQLSLIYRYCDEIILLLDNDLNNTGQKSAKKIYDMVSEELSCSIYKPKIGIVTLDEVSDPDSYLLKYGRDKLKKMINEKLKEIRNND